MWYLNFYLQVCPCRKTSDHDHSWYQVPQQKIWLIKQYCENGLSDIVSDRDKPFMSRVLGFTPFQLCFGQGPRLILPLVPAKTSLTVAYVDSWNVI
jgi:hypothetical protein